jgi:hypothetical protein
LPLRLVAVIFLTHARRESRPGPSLKKFKTGAAGTTAF